MEKLDCRSYEMSLWSCLNTYLKDCVAAAAATTKKQVQSCGGMFTLNIRPLAKCCQTCFQNRALQCHCIDINSQHLRDEAEILREGKSSNSREQCLLLFQPLFNVLHCSLQLCNIPNETF